MEFVTTSGIQESQSYELLCETQKIQDVDTTYTDNLNQDLTTTEI